MNKLGKANPVIWIAVVLIAIYFAYSAGYIGGPADDGVDDELVPSDLQCDLILKFKDELSTTDTNVNASYIMFNGDGTFFDSGEAGDDGKDTVTARVNTDYDIWAYNKLGESSGYLAKKFSANCGNKPKHTVTTKLVLRGGLTLSAMDDPVDLNQNISGTAGATEEFRAKWKVNVSNSGVRKPIIVYETNGTRTVIEDITITKADSAGGKYTEIPCPGRKDPSLVEHTLYCFQRDSDAYATDGTIITYAVVKIGSTAPGDLSWIQGQLIDTALYLEPGYSTIDGIKFGAEDEQENLLGGADTDLSQQKTSKTHFSD